MFHRVMFSRAMKELQRALCRDMHSHLRTGWESHIMDVHKWSRDLAEVRHTHVRNNIYHLQVYHMRVQHGKHYFLEFKFPEAR